MNTTSTSLPLSVIDRVARAYGLDAKRILPPQKGYRNQSFPIELASGEMVNLILYKSEPGILERILNANRTADFLAKQGVSTRRTYDARVIKMTSAQREKYACLYNYLSGNTIPWEGYTRRHIKLLGKTMSDMHQKLEGTALSSLSVIGEYETIIARMEKYFTDPHVLKALAQKLNLSPQIQFDYYKKLLKFCHSLPSQTLHMDFVRGNILFDGKGENLQISGILDFEKAANGPKLFDIARTLAFLLVDCKYVEPAKVMKSFLYSGYIKYGASKLDLQAETTVTHLLQDRHRFPVQRSEPFASGEWSRKGSVREFQVLQNLVTLFLIYDFYKFLRHNPYEYLEQNEHFIRTRDILQKRQRLSYYKQPPFTLQ